jgi:hypothetical protein
VVSEGGASFFEPILQALKLMTIARPRPIFNTISFDFLTRRIIVGRVIKISVLFDF